MNKLDQNELSRLINYLASKESIKIGNTESNLSSELDVLENTLAHKCRISTTENNSIFIERNKYALDCIKNQ